MNLSCSLEPSLPKPNLDQPKSSWPRDTGINDFKQLSYSGLLHSILAAIANWQRLVAGVVVLTLASMTFTFLFLTIEIPETSGCGVRIRRVNVKIRKDTFGSFHFLPCWHFTHTLKVPEISLVGCAVTIHSIDILMHFITNFKIILAAVILYHNGLIRCIFTNKTHFR